MKKRVDMSGVDWSQSNYAIARGIALIVATAKWRNLRDKGVGVA